MNGLAALALIVLFAQCAGNTDKQTTSAPAQAGGLAEMRIAYVEIDTLLAKYNYCIDLNEAMVKKGENVRLTLNQKASELEKQKQEFNSFRNIPDSFKKIVVVNGTKKPWRNEEGFVIMGMKYFLLNADSLEF